MLTGVKSELAAALATVIEESFGVDHDPIVEIPPRRELGDLAFPAPLQLARVLKRPPRDIAGELIERWRPPEVVREVTLAGAGYVNVFLQRSVFAHRAFTEPVVSPREGATGKVVVEHTNINPNKAAHIGHLRNSALGDTLVRVLRFRGIPVEVQFPECAHWLSLNRGGVL